jgi:phytoene synthase
MQITDGFHAARSMTKDHAKTFYFASHALPQQKRYAAYSIYALCRISDDSVDTDLPSRQLQNLSYVQRCINDVYNGVPLTNPLLSAFQQTVVAYSIPQQYFSELIDGMYMDLNKRSYENYDELYRYCYKVAGVVGLMMLKIFGATSKVAEAHAVELGIAMQLTNILRDIREDYTRGRVYLPRDEMEQFGVDPQSFSLGEVSKNFAELLQYQIRRARTYYLQSAAGIRMIADIRSRFVVCVMKEIYAQILSKIEQNNYDVFSTRAHVGAMEKITATFRILLKGAYR